MPLFGVITNASLYLSLRILVNMNEQVIQNSKSLSDEKNKSVSDLNLKALVVEDFETMRNIIANIQKDIESNQRFFVVKHCPDKERF